jgi:hypothetical protein
LRGDATYGLRDTCNLRARSALLDLVAAAMLVNTINWLAVTP